MKKMSKWIALALALVLLTTAALAANGQVQKTLDYLGIKISVDGQEITPTDVNGKSTEPFAIDGTVYLPIRAISEALGCAVEWDAKTNTVRISTEVEKDLLYTFYNDGEKNITDASLDKYFKEGTALAGVEALLDAGKVYVNGFQVPADESTTEFKVNGFTSLWKTETGWTNSVHKAQDSSNLTFEENRMRFIQGVSKLAGLTMELYCDDNSGYVTKIETTVKETVLVDKIMVDGDTTKIDRSNFKLAHKPGMPDINNTVFKTENVDPAINEGDMALYWEADDGWHLEAAVATTGKLTDGKDHGWYEFNGEKYPDSGLTKYSLAKANRPGQYLVAHQNLGLTDIEVTMWQTKTGYPFGFTSGDNADEVLTLAIENAEKAKVGVAVGESSDTLWVSKDAMKSYNAVIAEAKAALADKKSSNADLDRATYNLDQALKAFKSALSGTQMIWVDNDTQGTMSDLYGADAVTALADAGKITLNGAVIDGEVTANGAKIMYKNDDGTWYYEAQTLFKGTYNTYEEARTALLDALTQLRGSYYSVTYADGELTGLDFTLLDVAMAANITENADGTFKIATSGTIPPEETGRPNPTTLSFTKSTTEDSSMIVDGAKDIVCTYWYNDATDAWCIGNAARSEKAITVNVNNFKKSDLVYTDSRLSLHYSQSWNRPSQPMRCIGWMGFGEGSAEMYQWTVANGNVTVGFSRADGYADLGSFIAAAKAALASVKVSADGSDVAAGTMWVTQYYHDTFAKAIADAEAVYNVSGQANTIYEGALYRLAQAYGGQTGDRFSWLDNAYFGKAKDNSYDTGCNGTGFWTAAQASVK